MARFDLPAPVTGTEMLLYDIALSLRALVDLATPPVLPAPAETVALREPGRKKAKPAEQATREEMTEADQTRGE